MIILVNAAFIPSSAVLERQFLEVLWLSGNSFTISRGLVDDSPVVLEREWIFSSGLWNIVLPPIGAQLF